MTSPDHAPALAARRRRTALALALCLGLPSTPALAGVAVLDAGSATAWTIDPARSGLLAIQAQQAPATRAREQAYIGRLEEEIRRLNGRIEQLEYQQRNFDRRIDQLIEDLDQRLRFLEEGNGAPNLAATTGSAGAAAAAGSEREQAEKALSDLAASAEDGQLGRVPESAVSALPKPDPAEVAAPTSSTLSPEQQYENAMQLLQAGDYQGAQGGLEVFLDINGDHQLASNAAYWLAETHYVRQNYSAAAAAFARNYRTYGQESSKAVDNLLKLGMSLSSLGEADKACLTYDELMSAFPQRPAHIQQALSRERARAQCG